jgi:hypothetical protein
MFMCAHRVVEPLYQVKMRWILALECLLPGTRRYHSSVAMSVLMSSTPVATVLHSSNEHGDVTMLVPIVRVYKELDAVPPFSSSYRV